MKALGVVAVLRRHGGGGRGELWCYVGADGHAYAETCGVYFVNDLPMEAKARGVILCSHELC